MTFFSRGDYWASPCLTALMSLTAMLFESVSAVSVLYSDFTATLQRLVHFPNGLKSAFVEEAFFSLINTLFLKKWFERE